MDKIKSSRFKDAPWFPKEQQHVIIGGSGGIGSWLTLLLSRAGFTPIIYDFDIVEEHNMGGQLFSSEDIDSPKVQAISNMCKLYADTEVMANNEKYTSKSMSHHYVFSAFDNMKARKDMFDSWKEYVDEWNTMKSMNPESGGYVDNTPIFIDGRLLMEQLTIFCVTPDKISQYEEYLFSDDEVMEAPCTLKQTSHSASMIASHMTAFFTNHMTNNAVKDDDRIVPFKWEYFIPISHLNED